MTATLTIRPASRVLSLDVPGVDPQVRPIAFERAVQECGDLFVELDAQPRDLALGDAQHVQRLDQVVHRARGDALNVGLLGHRGERFLGRLAGF